MLALVVVAITSMVSSADAAPKGDDALPVHVVAVKSDKCVDTSTGKADEETVREMMERGMRTLTGAGTTSEAWQKFFTVSQYDARNKLIGTFQPKMNSSHEFASIEQFITQAAGASFTGGSVVVGSMGQATTKTKFDPGQLGAVGIMKPGSVSATLALNFLDGGEWWDSWARATTYSNGTHRFTVTVPDTSALGSGNVRVAFWLAGVTGSGY